MFTQDIEDNNRLEKLSSYYYNSTANEEILNDRLTEHSENTNFEINIYYVTANIINDFNTEK